MMERASSVIAMLAQNTTIGAYRILDKIGEGGMGAVYLGEHRLLRRRAAIKVLLPSLSSGEDVERLFHEARTLSLISDPGIVQIFDFGFHTDGRAYIVMELLDGESIGARLRRVRRFAVADCLRLAQRICTALEAAHVVGVIHRDLKPANLFLIADRVEPGGHRVKVLDFGIAKLCNDDAGTPKTRDGMLMGTPPYMSPEQCRCSGDIDPRSDLYALGCVLFTMLAGRPPFRSKAPGELIAAHLRELPPRLSRFVPDLPPVVDDIVQRCLNKLPADRYPSMSALAEALGAAEQALVRREAPAVPFAQSGVIIVPGGLVPDRDPSTLRDASGETVMPPPLAVPPADVRGRVARRRSGVRVGVALLAVLGTVAISRRGAVSPPSPPAVSAVPAVDTAAPIPPPPPARGSAMPPWEPIAAAAMPTVPAVEARPAAAVPDPAEAAAARPPPSVGFAAAASPPAASPSMAVASVRRTQGAHPRASRKAPAVSGAGEIHVSRSTIPAPVGPMDVDRGN